MAEIPKYICTDSKTEACIKLNQVNLDNFRMGFIDKINQRLWDKGTNHMWQKEQLN
jgi:hypothetical protein